MCGIGGEPAQAGLWFISFPRIPVRRGDKETLGLWNNPIQVLSDACLQERIDPLDNIVLPDGSSEPSHPNLAFFIFHKEGGVDRIRHLPPVIGIDQERIVVELGSGAGKFTQNKDAFFLDIDACYSLAMSSSRRFNGVTSGNLEQFCNKREVPWRGNDRYIIKWIGIPADLGEFPVDLSHDGARSPV